MNASHVRSVIPSADEARTLGLSISKDEEDHWHALGETLFIKIIDGLNDVTEAYRGTQSAEKTDRRENYFLLVSQFSTENSTVINIPVQINKEGRFNNVKFSVNQVATAYGKKNFRKYIAKELANGNLVKIKRRDIKANERTAPIAVGYGEDISTVVNSTTSSSESQSPKSTKDRAVMTTDRIDYLIADSGAGMRKDYARSWITSINPTDFLNMTLREKNQK